MSAKPVENYATGRNNPFEKTSSVELNELLGTVADSFGKDWLTSVPLENRVQVLWARQDGLATNQLATLGDSIKRLSKLNADWVARRVKQAKLESTQDRKGDLFEILGLSLLELDGQSVACAPEGKPGYDGTIDFGDGASASVSLKDFGSSYFQRNFECQAAATEDKLREA